MEYSMKRMIAIRLPDRLCMVDPEDISAVEICDDSVHIRMKRKDLNYKFLVNQELVDLLLKKEFKVVSVKVEDPRAKFKKGYRSPEVHEYV